MQAAFSMSQEKIQIDDIKQLELQEKSTLPDPLFSVFLFTPFCNLCNQAKRQRLIIGKPDGPFTGLISLQLACKGFHCRRAGIQADVLL